MLVFVSYNCRDKVDARLVAGALAKHGASVWFDEWNIRPGESIAEGIEGGLANSDVFLLIWSQRAAESRWVGSEFRAYLHRRVADASLRIVPVMLDETALPLLVADYLGFKISDSADFEKVAAGIVGETEDRELAQLLQARLWELSTGKVPEGSPHKYLVCPQCGSPNLHHKAHYDDYKQRMMFSVTCMEENCKFMRAEFGDERSGK
jgi:hypothetical protein